LVRGPLPSQWLPETMPSRPWTLILLFGWEGWSAKRCNVCHAFRTMTGSFENRDVANWTSHFGCKLKISWNLGCCFIMLDWIQCFKKCSVGIFYVVRIGSKFFSRERSRCLPGSHAWNHPATLCGTSAQLKVELSDPQNLHFPTVAGRAIGPTLWVANNGCKSESIITLPAANSLLLKKTGIFFTLWNCSFYGPSVALGFSSNPQPFWATKTDSEPGKKSSSTFF